jgi:hypothetical protein
MQIDAKWIENLFMTMALEKKKIHKKKSCMQLNVLQLYLNGLMNFFHIHLYMSWIIPFETIEIIIQMLHIALINICWNIHNNLMPHIYTWTSQWTFNICTSIASFTFNVLNPLLTSCILHSSQFLEMDVFKNFKKLIFITEWVSD